MLSIDIMSVLKIDPGTFSDSYVLRKCSFVWIELSMKNWLWSILFQVNIPTIKPVVVAKCNDKNNPRNEIPKDTKSINTQHKDSLIQSSLMLDASRFIKIEKTKANALF